MQELIKISGLEKAYGSHKVLSGIDLSIKSGSVYGLVGLNGAGKTTLLRILSGILKADSGSVVVAGMNPWKHSSSYYERLGIVLEHDGFWGNLTIKENLKVFSDAKQLRWKNTLEYVEEFWGNTVIATSIKKVKQLSRGQRMQCALCRAFLGWPDVVFLDEPAIALDMNAYNHFAGIVRQAHKGGASLIISSHQLDTIDDLCDRVGNLCNGSLGDLVKRHSDGIYRWVMTTDADVNCEQVLIVNNCCDIENESGHWYFGTSDPGKYIPSIVQMMVEAKYPVYEIMQEKTEFSDTIKSIYCSPDKEPEHK